MLVALPAANPPRAPKPPVAACDPNPPSLLEDGLENPPPPRTDESPEVPDPGFEKPPLEYLLVAFPAANPPRAPKPPVAACDPNPPFEGFDTDGFTNPPPPRADETPEIPEAGFAKPPAEVPKPLLAPAPNKPPAPSAAAPVAGFGYDDFGYDAADVLDFPMPSLLLSLDPKEGLLVGLDEDAPEFNDDLEDDDDPHCCLG